MLDPSRDTHHGLRHLSGKMFRAFQPKLFQAAAECARIDAELFRCALRPVNPPVRLVEHVEHMPAFDVLKIDRGVVLQTRLRQGQELRIDVDDRRCG